MRRFPTPIQAPTGTVLLTVETILRTHVWFFLTDAQDTVAHLKKEICPLLEASEAEVALCVNPDYPYPLRDDLLLRHLRDEHRTLIAIVHEAPDRAIPMRVLSRERICMPAGPHPIARPPRTGVLDLRGIYSEDIPYLTRWVTLHPDLGRVDVDWTSPLLDAILRELQPALYATAMGSLWLRRNPECTDAEHAARRTPARIDALCHLVRNMHMYVHRGTLLADPGILSDSSDPSPVTYSEEKLNELYDRLVAGTS